jgi:hypothetical protein
LAEAQRAIKTPKAKTERIAFAPVGDRVFIWCAARTAAIRTSFERSVELDMPWTIQDTCGRVPYAGCYRTNDGAGLSNNRCFPERSPAYGAIALRRSLEEIHVLATMMVPIHRFGGIETLRYEDVELLLPGATRVI